MENSLSILCAEAVPVWSAGPSACPKPRQEASMSTEANTNSEKPFRALGQVEEPAHYASTLPLMTHR